MIDRAHLEAKRAEHTPYVVGKTSKKRCQICLSIWPCEQSEILDLALDGIEMRARVNVAGRLRIRREALQDNPQATEAIAELDTIIDALTLTDALQAKLEQAEQALVAAESMAVLFGNVPLKSHWGIARDKAIEAYRAALEETR